MITEQDAAIAKAQGKERGLAGGSQVNPHAKAFPTREERILRNAWEQGYAEGAAIRAADNEWQREVRA